MSAVLEMMGPWFVFLLGVIAGLGLAGCLVIAARMSWQVPVPPSPPPPPMRGYVSRLRRHGHGGTALIFALLLTPSLGWSQCMSGIDENGHCFLPPFAAALEHVVPQFSDDLVVTDRAQTIIEIPNDGRAATFDWPAVEACSAAHDYQISPYCHMALDAREAGRREHQPQDGSE